MCHTVNSSENPSLWFVLEIVFVQSLPRYMTISEGRNEDRFKYWQVCCIWKHPFCHHRAIKLTQNCVCFTFCASISLFRLPSLANITPRFLNFSTCKCKSVFPLACIANCMCFWWIMIPSDFTVNFHPGLVARSWKPSNCMLKTMMRRCRQHQIVRRNKTFDPAASTNAWHPRWLGCVCLSNSHGIRRGVVTTHTLVVVQNSQWTVVI